MPVDEVGCDETCEGQGILLNEAEDDENCADDRRLFRRGSESHCIGNWS